MPANIINIGTSVNSRDGDSIRAAFTKVNNNFTELYDAVALLGEGQAGDGVIEITVKGDIVSTNNTVLIDSTTGKVTFEALPNAVPLEYEFRANFDMDGDLTTIINLPPDWTYTESSNIATITHNLIDRHPKIVSYWGLSTTGEFRLRYPTAGYQVTRPADNSPSFKLNLNSGATGASPGQYATITVVF